jgi:hypothetical protein
MTPRSRSALLALAAMAAAVLVFVYLWVAERDFGRDLLRALFGLSGGTTAGG